jgi:PAS domain S-box-containing protein
VTATEIDGHVLVYAPHGRDAVVARDLIGEVGLAATICEDIAGLVEQLTDDAVFVVATVEAVKDAGLRALTEKLALQPPWSDIPVILLTRHGGGLERNPEAGRLAVALGNVSFLERPFHPTTFISVARSALKSRQRQFEVRARIEEIREGEANLQNALLAGRLGSWQLELPSRLFTTSADCKALFGLSPDAAFDYEDLVAAIRPDDRPGAAAKLERSLATGEDYEVEYRIGLPDGRTRWAEIRARLVRDRDGAPNRLIGVASDITDRKESENALRNANEILERHVADRTAELRRAHDERLAEVEQRERAEALLHQSQKTELIGQLTGGVAHDFNNLLMVVLGNLELLRKFLPADAHINRLFEGAVEGAQRGAGLTQRLLAFARRQELDIAPRDINALVRGMTDLLERSVGGYVRIRYELDAATPLAAVDANQIELALMNLVVNARDAMPDGGEIQILVDTVEAPSPGAKEAARFVRLQVRDAGVGMDSATLAKATEPFFSTKPVGKGTGLGLSMIHGLAAQLGGELRLTSEPGVGTTAELLLPATDAPLEPIPPIAQERPTSVRSFHILVVDDDPLIAMSTVGMLEDLGHAVTECSSGQEALHLLADGSPLDLLITDYAMPQMNGLELARAALALRPGLSVLLASGYADIPDASSVEVPRIAKPYMQAQLREAIARATSKP